jgi:glycosyltransferase involved in cell wall biosynthesis
VKRQALLSICLVSQEFPPYTNWGGVGVQFDLLARGLAGRGHRVVVVARAADGAPAFERMPSGVEVRRIGVPITRKRFVGRTVDRMLHARAVVHTVAGLDRAQRFDAFEAPVASLDAERLVAAARFAARVVICCHGTNLMGQSVGGLLGPLHALDWRWSARREQVSLGRASAVVVSSLFTQRTVLAQGVDPGKIALIPLGIEIERFAPPADTRPASGPLTVGFVGRLEEVKGIDFVWRVLDRIAPDAGIRFVFKGHIHPSTRAAVLAQLRRHAAIARHEPPGGHDEMPEFLRSLDVLLQPSRIENFGLTYAEGMATGLVVFAGRGGAGAEVVSDGVTGFLVDPDGPVDDVVARLVELARERRAFDAVRRRARAFVVDRVSIDHFISAKEAHYAGLRST